MVGKSLSPELKTAIEASKKGAKEALRYYEKNNAIEVKKDKTIFTIADKNTEKIIIEYVRSKYPKAKFVAEESGGDKKESSFWTIDPIDGSRSFTRGVPTWAILIALVKDEEVVLGVCNFPLMNILLYAEKGRGAYFNNKRVKVSKVKQLKDAYVGFGSPRHFKDKQVLVDLIEASAGVRSPEATFCAYLVSTGKMDAHVDAYGKLWDLAPFKVILEEAGGIITHLNGSKWTFFERGCIMTNGILHNEVLRLVNNRL